jgi:hypothetical protein
MKFTSTLVSLTSLTTLFITATVVIARPGPQAAGLSKAVRGATVDSTKPETANGTLPAQYTLTAYLPDNEAINGLKVNSGGGLNIHQAVVASYCPVIDNSSAHCPNGTDTVFVGYLAPIELVPGGQDLYVAANGLIQITVQHSHFIPSDAYAYGIGWQWTALPLPRSKHHKVRHCPRDNPEYNCDPPTGYFTFIAPGATVGGVVACENKLWAVTPAFNQTGCTVLKGLGTHNYTGISPPVWSYI